MRMIPPRRFYFFAGGAAAGSTASISKISAPFVQEQIVLPNAAR
jgi:hypothetical protein